MTEILNETAYNTGDLYHLVDLLSKRELRSWQGTPTGEYPKFPEQIHVGYFTKQPPKGRRRGGRHWWNKWVSYTSSGWTSARPDRIGIIALDQIPHENEMTVLAMAACDEPFLPEEVVACLVKALITTCEGYISDYSEETALAFVQQHKVKIRYSTEKRVTKSQREARKRVGQLRNDEALPNALLKLRQAENAVMHAEEQLAELKEQRNQARERVEALRAKEQINV